MDVVEFDQPIKFSSEEQSDLFSTATASTCTAVNTSTDTHQQPSQAELLLLSQETSSSSFVESEWDPIEFDLLKSSNPKWKSARNTQQQQLKKKSPKRIQDIRLARLDSGESSSSHSSPNSAAASDDFWPYDDAPGSPCALFGKNTSSPADGFKGEFSSYFPEWEDSNSTTMEEPHNSTSRRQRSSREKSSRDASSSDKRRRERRKQQQQEQPQHDEEEEGDGDDQSVGSYELDASESASEGEEVEEDEEGEFSDESERSITQSSNYDDDNLMVTPAVGKVRESRKKPPTLKRGAHGVATPSVVKAMKDKQAFTSDDEGDNAGIDFDAEFDSDMESVGSGQSSRSKSSRDNGSRSKRDGRLEAANASFRRSSVSKRKEKFAFDRSMSSADLKAARKANNSFKGHADMNKSFSAMDNKRRMNRTKSRSEGRMQQSFSGSSSGRKSSSSQREKSPPPAESRSSRKSLPTRAKSMGHPAGGGSKLKSALAKFSGAADEPTSNTNATGKKSSTLSALKALSGGDGPAAGSGGDNETDLKNAIMRQVYQSSSGLKPIELKRKPKPKITKTTSLTGTTLTRAAAASGEIFPSKESSSKSSAPTQRVRRSKTSSERNLSSISDFNASYHENIAKMRKQKMVDASERSAISQGSSKSEPKEQEQPTKEKERPHNLDRRVKSFSHSRSGASMSASARDDDDNSSGPSPGGSKQRVRGGSSKRDVDNEDSSSRRNLSKSGSSRRLQQQKDRVYDASFQPPTGTNVIALLRDQEPVTDNELMQKGNRQLFHALMYKTRMGIDMERLQRKVNGEEDSEDEKDDNKHQTEYDDEEDYATESGEE
ncbi:expressed unknown protein [Seminavis robusta]|uniref:Uncharacterized protein n=1 Tax=Seminavis robusta TaxID=568900 RepID=A0A9N8HG40_9STRA|nr:expressed unknown protein [Seminavis robusta]|eukprot:Sro463_g148270.2  (831) ;mRNA; r:47017-49509